MTYDLTNRITLIENLQRMLRYLSFVKDDPKLRVNINGEYDSRTESAVKRYQEISGLQVTGETDIETWNRIKRDYDREIKLREDIYIVPVPRDPSYATGHGERSDTVAILQIILSALRRVYEYPEVSVTGIFGQQTADAVRVFQRANGLDDTGIADRKTWQRLAEEYNTLLSE